MTRALPPWAPAAVFLLAHLIGAGGAFEHQIINFNFETVQVTWDASPPSGTNLTFLYGFKEKNDSECPNYLLQNGRRVGCLLVAEGDTILNFSVWNGTQCLKNRSLWISDYLKPSSPRGLRVLWREEAVTVTCPDLPWKGLLYEVQYKSSFDGEWQPKAESTCNVTIQDLDAEKCYSFRARVTAMKSSYGSTTYPSDWSEVIHQQRGQPRDSCQEERVFSKSVLIYGLAALLLLLLLVLCVWKLQRVKRLLMPSVPDPKATFAGLFESHHGNFQEWIKDTQNLTHLQKVEDREPEDVLMEGLEVQPSKVEAETPVTTMAGPPGLQTVEKETSGTPSQLPGRPPQGEEVLALGGFRFTMSDNSYVML
ncbi:cytokine receptor-like factor 2 [Myotis myotis]|uniref:Cytokine receptor-like factor 2 n=1 Tax=Myotis myotis TaxID=51298 RepID=A0A7J7QVM0_MYOMY|nr:cytokine receptor-like factor 2 [Myotis myotis]KAF6267843.1 cytokine receptor like factor 2 [Myotis myotis]